MDDNSILNSVKKMLGIDKDYTHFDPDIIMHINSVFSILTQLGVGPENGFSIIDENATWDDYLSESDSKLEMVKSYVFQKVRLLFDPPLSSTVIECMKQTINEFEWRLNVAVELDNRMQIQK